MNKLAASLFCVSMAATALGCAPESEVDEPIDVVDSEASSAVGVSTQALMASPAKFTNCNETQLSTLGWGIWPQARRIAKAGLDNFNASPNGTAAKTWFGSPAHSRVKNVLVGVENALATEQVNILCDEGHPSCNGFYARAQGDTIRLCAAFWEGNLAPATLTFLHELAHLHGAPLDTPNTPDTARSLARTNTNAVSQSAYVYEYYYTQFVNTGL